MDNTTLEQIIIGILGVNTAFTWSLHYKVTKLMIEREHCVFCNSGASQDEFNKLKHNGVE